MAPQSSKIKLKKECFQCGYFNPEMGAKRYKCAGSKCPAFGWSKAKIKAVLLSYNLNNN